MRNDSDGNETDSGSSSDPGSDGTVELGAGGHVLDNSGDEDESN